MPESSKGITRRELLRGAAATAAAAGLATTKVSGVDAQEQRPVDVVVIGAGASGLNAAVNLHKADKRVVVLEANDRVGGRLMPGRIGGQVIDLGGQWVGPQQTRVLELTQEYGMHTYPTYVTGDTLLEVAGEVYRSNNQGVGLPGNLVIEFGGFLMKVNKMAQEVPVTAPWTAPNAKAWDSITAASFLRESVKDDGLRELIRAVVEVVYSVAPSQMSLLQLLWYAASGGSMDNLINTENGAQQDLFVEGFHNLTVRMAKELGDRVVLDSPVRAIEQSEAGVTVRADRGTWKASRVVVSVPPPTAARIEYGPGLPALRDGLMQRMPMGWVIKCFMAYEKPFWREKNLNGTALGGSFEFGSLFDVTAPGNEQGVLCGFFDGGPAIRWSDKSAEERREKVLDDTARFLGKKAKKPLEYIEQNWPQEPWSKGGYTSIPTPGTLTHFGPALREPCGRIHWAGTETSDVWSGYVEGAVRSGDRVAKEVQEYIAAEA